MDVIEIRSRFEQTQEEFAEMMGISIHTLRNWERGRRCPHGPARALLRLANADPEAVAKVLIRERRIWEPHELEAVAARIERWRKRKAEERAAKEEARREASARLEEEVGSPEKQPTDWLWLLKRLEK